MGRGRGKGKKLTAVTTHDDVGNEVEEALPTYRRRGRLQKHLMDDINEDDNIKNEEEFTEEMKHSVSANELKHSMVQKGKKRKRYSQVKENTDSVSEENNDELNQKSEETTKSNGFVIMEADGRANLAGLRKHEL